MGVNWIKARLPSNSLPGGWAREEDGIGVATIIAGRPDVIMTAGGIMIVLVGIMIVAVMIIVLDAIIAIDLGLAPGLPRGTGMIVVGLVLAVRMIGTVGGTVVVRGGMMIGGRGMEEDVVIVLVVDVGTVLGVMERRAGRYCFFSE
jgi:hypothetical protein